MKNIKRTLALLLAMVMVLTMLPLAAVAEDQSPTPTEPQWPHQGAINLSKTATSTENTNEYLVELKIQGKNYHTSSDVVLVIDNSNSMYDRISYGQGSDSHNRMYYTKLAAKAFVNQLLTEGSDTRIALVVYGEIIHSDTGFYTATTKEDLISAIESISQSKAYGGTNTQAGIHKARELLNSDASTGKLKNIVLLSDGVPTHSYKLTGTASWNDKCYTTFWGDHQWGDWVSGGAVDESTIVVTSCDYNTRVGDGSANSGGKLRGTVTCAHGETRTGTFSISNTPATVWEAQQAKNKGATIYSVAFQAGSEGEEILKSCASDPTVGKGYFAIAENETDLEGTLTSAFTAIAGSIAIAASQGVVSDPMSEHVTMNIAGAALVVTHDEAVFTAGNADLYISQGNASWDAKNETITWTVGNINEGSDATMRYRVTLKDTVQKGQTVPTNKTTTFSYKNYQGRDTVGYFDVPEVTVNGGTIRLHFYQVNADGQPVNSEGTAVEAPKFANELATATYYEVNGSKALDYGTYSIAATDITNYTYYGYTFDGTTASVDGEATPVSVTLTATNAARELWFAYRCGFQIVHVQDGEASDPVTYTVEDHFNITEEVSNGYLYGGTFSDEDCTAIWDYEIENPTDFTPEAGATYYIWEVSKNYLMPKLYRAYAHPTAYNGAEYVTQLHLLTTVDRDAYTEVGFLANIDTEKPTLSTTVKVHKNGELYETLYVAENGSLGSKKAADVNEIVSGTGCVVTYSLTAEQFAAFEGTDTPVIYEPYWITLDGVKVTNTTRTATHQGAGYNVVDTKDTPHLSAEYVLGSTEPEALAVMAVYTLDYDAAPAAPVVPDEPVQPATVTVTVHDGGTYEIAGEPGKFDVTPKGAEGKLFAGWYADEAFTEVADLTDVQEDADIYAKYVSDNYLQVKYNNLGLLGRGSLRLVSAVDSKAYAETGFVVNGEKLVVSSYTTRYNLQTGKTLFGVDRNDPLMVVSYSYKNLRRGDTIEIRAYWITPDGTIVYGDVRTLTYGRFGLEG